MTTSRKYKALLLDADNTIFDFDRCEMHALRDTFEKFGVGFNGEILSAYHNFNDALWKQIEQGTLSRADLRRDRFTMFMRSQGRDEFVSRGTEMGEYFVSRLGTYTFYIEGMDGVCAKLAEKYKLYVITNGITTVQESRFRSCSILPILGGVFISEAIGYSKPDARYFDAVLKLAGGIQKSDCLIIGDSLTSDIQGGFNSDIDTCFFDRENHTDPYPKPTYTVRTPIELLQLLQ